MKKLLWLIVLVLALGAILPTTIVLADAAEPPWLIPKGNSTFMAVNPDPTDPCMEAVISLSALNVTGIDALITVGTNMWSAPIKPMVPTIDRLPYTFTANLRYSDFKNVGGVAFKGSPEKIGVFFSGNGMDDMVLRTLDTESCDKTAVLPASTGPVATAICTLGAFTTSHGAHGNFIDFVSDLQFTDKSDAVEIFTDDDTTNVVPGHWEELMIDGVISRFVIDDVSGLSHDWEPPHRENIVVPCQSPK